MALNDQIVLEHLLQDQKNRIALNATESEFFELFTAEQVLKNYDLSYEEIQFEIGWQR